jgi:hypothetical protein
MEHRRSPRTRTILQGRVVFNNRFSLIECTVRDLSDTGAQITFSHPVSLPSELELEIPKKGLSTRANVMWSNGIHHGLMFLEAAQDEARDSSPAPYGETMAPDKRSPQEDEIDGPALTIQDVLEEARSRIAHIAGVPAEMVRLKLEIDFWASSDLLHWTGTPAPFWNAINADEATFIRWRGLSVCSNNHAAGKQIRIVKLLADGGFLMLRKDQIGMIHTALNTKPKMKPSTASPNVLPYSGLTRPSATNDLVHNVSLLWLIEVERLQKAPFW